MSIDLDFLFAAFAAADNEEDCLLPMLLVVVDMACSNSKLSFGFSPICLASPGLERDCGARWRYDPMTHRNAVLLGVCKKTIPVCKKFLFAVGQFKKLTSFIGGLE